MEPLRIVLVVALALALLVAAVTDLRARIIPNRLNLAIACAAPLWWWAFGLGPSAMLLQIGCAAGALLLFGALFALGAMGGGDVKLIAALALWLPAGALLHMLVLMAIAGGVLTAAMLLRHRIRRLSGRPEIPYGVAIVAATLLTLANDILTSPAA